jgi:transcription initiation factor TFIIIB Brf1 subunit/transcription initiation factor TFIIB
MSDFEDILYLHQMVNYVKSNKKNDSYELDLGYSIYIKKKCKQLKINNKHANIAVRIANNCYKMNLALNKKSEVVAAGAVLMIVRWYGPVTISRETIAQIFRVEVEDMNKMHREMLPHTEKLSEGQMNPLLSKM